MITEVIIINKGPQEIIVETTESGEYTKDYIVKANNETIEQIWFEKEIIISELP